jgi:tryptophan synthase alpha chain
MYMKDKPSLMAHCIAFFPDRDRSVAVARGLARGGADYIEVQFPFSDPTADGPAIQSACQTALEHGFTVDEGFRLIDQLSSEIAAPVFIMSYGNLVYRRGVDRFCRDAAAAGAAGLIIPDFLPPADEGLYQICREYGLDAMPVISPGISEARLTEVAAQKPNYMYTTLRSGITGSHTEIGPEQIDHLERCRSTGAHVMAGFGIESPEQVQALRPYTDTLVVGSYFVKEIIRMGPEASAEQIERHAGETIRYILF